MEIRNLKENEFDAAKAIASYCFGFGREAGENARFFAQKASPDVLYGAFVDGTLASCLFSLPYTVRIRGRMIPCGGISTVATLPEYRNRGLMKALLLHALEEMRGKKQWISILGPFLYSFYRKYGWAQMYETMSLEFPQEMLACFMKYASLDHPKDQYTLRRCEAADLPALNRVYQAWTQQYEAVFERPEQIWQHEQEWRDENNHALYVAVDSTGCIQGYMHYEIRGKTFNIYELIHATRDARHALLHFVHMHRAEIETVQWRNMPLDDLLLVEADSPNQKRSIHPSMTGRITDIAGFFSEFGEPPPSPFLKPDSPDLEHATRKKVRGPSPAQLAGQPPSPLSAAGLQTSDPGSVSQSTSSPSPCSLKIKVDDDFAHWNAAVWHIQADGSSIVASKTQDAPQLSCDTGVLTQIITGWLCPRRAAEAGCLKVKDQTALENLAALFPQRLTWMHEVF